MHGFLFDGDIYARIAAFGTGAPGAQLRAQRQLPALAPQRLAHRATAPLVDGLVANSHYGRAFAQKLYGFAPERCTSSWNGMRLEELERQAAQRDCYKTEFFGTDE